MHKSGFVNIIGKPNVGKSTFLNHLMGEKYSIVTSKPQTTRHRILLIYNDEDHQIVFSDLPGLISTPAYELQRAMNKYIYSSFEDADAFVFIVDVFDDFIYESKFIDALTTLEIPKFLIVNKSDISDNDKINSTIDHWKGVVDFRGIFVISALKGDNIDNLLESIKKILPSSPPFYPKDQVTDRSERFFVEEIVREQILLLYKKEVPYSVQVVIQDWKFKTNNNGEKLLYIRAFIFVERKSQKSILIGKDGAMIKKLGTASRIEIEKFLDQKIYLDLNVKELDDWRNNQKNLRDLGY